MQKRSVRLTVIALLLVAPPATACLWKIERDARRIADVSDVVVAHVDRMIDAVGGIGTAQQSYVAPGQLDEPSFERVNELVAALKADLVAVAPLVRSPGGAEHLRTFSESLDSLVTADGRTRQNLKLGQDLMAADVIFSDGRNLLDGMTRGLRDVQAAERTACHAALASLSWQRWILLAVVLLLWVPLGAAIASAPTLSVAIEKPATPRVPVDNAPATASATTPSLDLAAAAAVCTDLARAHDTAMLSQVLNRAASILDASGMIVWMSAGEQLFAVLGCGYSPATLARFGPISRPADNAAATAWRNERLTVVAADGTGPGGLVAPMCGPAGCTGVLALEIRAGREQDPVVQAVTAMVAAQLATAVAAWPAASLTESPEARTA